MDIKSSLASQGYLNARNVATPESEAGAADNFLGAVKNFQETLAKGEQAAEGAMLGQVEPHTLVTALAQSELAVETVVAVRNKVVDAYQEILRMQV